jgi:hypothetical protein
MFRFFSFKLVAFIVLFAIPLAARSQKVITTGNSSIAVDVTNDGTGLISIYKAGTSPKDYLTYPGLSFLTVLASGVLYTNDFDAPDASPPAIPSTPIQLTDGVDTLLQSPSGNDTIRTTWSCADSAFDIIQEVYPVLFGNGGQIVIRVRAVNHTNNTLSVQAQYLLDINIFVSPFESDNAKIATISGYTTNWQTFSQPNAPPFYIAFQNDLGTPNFPGVVASGFLTDSLAPIAMGLMRPSAFTVVDWTTIVQTYTWGWPSSAIGSPFADEAVLIQWPSKAVGTESSKDTVAEIARTSYGTGGYTECNGNVDAFTFYPYLQHELRFPVASLIFNNSSQTLSSLKATLSVDSFFRVVSPLPVSAGGLTQTQSLNPAILPPASMGAAMWTDTLSATSTQDTSTMRLSLSANSVSELSNCFLDVLPRRSGDFTSPSITLLSKQGSFNGSLCNSRCINEIATDSGSNETGIQSVTADQSSINNMQLVLPKTDTMNRPSELFSVCVIDSMQDGFATVTVRDEAGNADSASFRYCTIPDTLAPLVLQIPNKQNITVSIKENRPWDRGIATIVILSDSNLNVTFNPPNNWEGATEVQVLAVPINAKKPAELCLQVFDIAANKIDACFDYAVSEVAIEIAQPLALSVLPNPSEDRFEIQLSGSVPGSAEGEILDLLGRTVGRFSFDESYSFDARQLPSGVYILRVNLGDEVLTERIIRE